MWAPIDEAIKHESVEFDSIVSIVDVLKAIKFGTVDNLPFFFRENIQRGS